MLKRKSLQLLQLLRPFVQVGLLSAPTAQTIVQNYNAGRENKPLLEFAEASVPDEFEDLHVALLVFMRKEC